MRYEPKVGDVFCSTWGYDQTNVDFYKIVEVGRKTVKIVKIGKKVVKDLDHVVRVVPDPDKEIGDRMTRKLKYGKDWVCFRVASYATAFLWDGKPVLQTGFGWGH